MVPIMMPLLEGCSYKCRLKTTEPSSYLPKLTKVPPVQKELLTLHEHMCSLQIVSGVRVVMCHGL